MVVHSAKLWPAAFLASERRTPPRLLPLWAVSLIALAGHSPGVAPWAVAATLSLALGILLAPLVGSISLTVVAYVWMLALVGGMVAVTWYFPMGEWYHQAWIDPGVTGLLAMILMGAVAVGAAASTLWAALVVVEASRRYARRKGAGASAAASQERAQEQVVATAHVIPPATPRGRTWLVPGLRCYTAILCLALLVPLPSFLVISGIYVRPAMRPHAGVGGLLGDLVTASVWPAMTVGWLAVGAFVVWLAWRGGNHRARDIGLGASSLLVTVVLLAGATFAIVPSGTGAQSFAPEVLEYCPVRPEGTACQPEWLFSAPWLADVTSSVAPWVALLLVAGTAAMIAISWRSRRGGTAAATRA